MTEQTTLLEFPCEFPIKAFGKHADDFEAHIYALVQAHVPELERSAVTARDSRGGKYLAVTVHIIARSQAHLDAIYGDLSNDDAVLMAL
ncbi:hypothetical protein T5B8_16944 [Salinisphaera sp. T5B8]|uniref:YbeD family protein n=1 Tax=Salinisphaera sp. T5B8 TaxID=1304154 RepID=UPI0033416DD6